MSAAETAHVVAFAFPFGSHPTPLLHLVQRLAAAAPTVHFSYFNTKKSNHNVFSKANLHVYDNIKAYDVEDGLPEGHAFSGNPLEEIEFFIGATPENFRRRLDEIVEETGLKATCLLTDAFLSFSSEMAAEMGIPWVAVWTAGPTAVSIHSYTDLIHGRLGQTGHPENQDQTLDFLPGMAAIHASDLPQEVVHLDTPFSRLLHSMSRSLPRAAAVVLNSFDGIDPVVENDLSSKLRKVLNVGPFPLPSPMPPSDDQSGCLSWLSTQSAASVAYLSFGTMLTPPPHELVALADSLEEKQIPYLWSFRDNSKINLLQGFFERTSSRGKVVEWAPQLQVLAHSSVGVFVTHSGWNSVVESIVAGVPLICRPFFGDQMMNRRRVEDVWRIGVGVEGGIFTKSGMAGALNLVLFEEEGKKMRENIGGLRECALRAVAENGSSTQNFKSLVQIATSSHQD
ncbi:UDP-glucuronosyl and UDP-glucosyl transferase [Handroanthus impetiginosus]|uniref:Glycosyltransferase n=1 Tax=Handroanthus impetiginosus TaxID=429701 RepID=A0A2G9G6V8_9LAMI|nr:UDP-glucuronosyl and UDP-glucosyl transferase [Handroanthus impetiginosus]